MSLLDGTLDKGLTSQTVNEAGHCMTAGQTGLLANLLKTYPTTQCAVGMTRLYRGDLVYILFFFFLNSFCQEVKKEQNLIKKKNSI